MGTRFLPFELKSFKVETTEKATEERIYSFLNNYVTEKDEVAIQRDEGNWIRITFGRTRNYRYVSRLDSLIRIWGENVKCFTNLNVYKLFTKVK